MRKWLWSLGYVALAVAVIFLVLPFFMGMLAENKCKQIIAISNTTMPLNVKILSYERHWFSADASLSISFDKDKLAKNDLVISSKELNSDSQLYQFNVTAHITHGPVIVNSKGIRFAQAIADADINLNEKQRTLLKRAENAGPVATVMMTSHLTGSSTIAVDSQPLAYQDADASFRWQGLQVKIELSPLANAMVSSINLPGIDIGLKDHIFHVARLISSYQGNKVEDGVWIGERNLQVQSFASQIENYSVALGGLNLHIATTDQKAAVNSAFTIAIDSLSVNGFTFAKSLLDFEINNLNKKQLAKFHQRLSTVRDGDEVSLKRAHQSMDDLMAMLSLGVELNVKQFNSTTPWGKFFATTKIEFATAPNAGLIAMLAGCSMQTNIKVERSLALYLTENFYKLTQPQSNVAQSAQNAEKLLTEWQQAGKIGAPDKDNLINLDLKYKPGQFLLNDKPLIGVVPSNATATGK